MISAERIRLALHNHSQPGRTPGARIRDALQHVRRYKEKPGCVAGLLKSSGQAIATEVTLE